jgi:hypothetical protein
VPHLCQARSCCDRPVALTGGLQGLQSVGGGSVTVLCSDCGSAVKRQSDLHVTVSAERFHLISSCHDHHNLMLHGGWLVLLCYTSSRYCDSKMRVTMGAGLMVLAVAEAQEARC